MTKGFSNILLLATVLTLMVSACADKGVPQNNKADADIDLSYSDNLAKYRPVVSSNDASDTTIILQNSPVFSTSDISEKLNGVLDSMILRNDTLATLSGYTILVYSGTNERDAGRVRNRLFDILPAMEAKIQYKLPTYFVKIGEFHQLIEAQPLYQKIKKYYPTATVVPEQFKLEK